jgi:DNA polymerase (family 10)
MENIDYAHIFEEIADLLEIEGANPFRVRAYRNAARTLERLTQSVESLLRSGEKPLTEIPGIGKDLAAKIAEIHQTGKLQFLNDLRAHVPPSLLEILKIPGLGAKRVHQLWQSLGITTMDQLGEWITNGKLDGLRGFGEALKSSTLKGIEEVKSRMGRFRIVDADHYVNVLLPFLRNANGIVDLELAGSFRRRCETVGDLDVLATTSRGSNIMSHFVSFPEVKEVLVQGRTKTSVRLHSGLQVDLRLLDQQSYGAAMHHFTGSKAHNIAIRGIGHHLGLKINEYGIFRADDWVGGENEEQVFRSVGLSWIPPELRENRGEVEAAASGRLPRLVELQDIKGDLQMHSEYSDGQNTLLEMIQSCRDRGYHYMALTDHSQAVRVAGGLKADDFKKQFKEIDRLQKRFPEIRVLKSAEVDILADGSLDLEDAILEQMDVVLVSIHSKFNMPKAEMTHRMIRAIRHPRVNILGHPTGRLINQREPYLLELEEVVKAAKEEGVLLEANAHPERLDLQDYHLQLAKQAGVKIVINTDSHRTSDLDYMRYGVDQARRGWLEKSDVANTLPLNAFLKLLKK